VAGESKKRASTCGTSIQKDRGQLSALCVYLSLARGGGLQMGRGGQMACTSAKQLLNYPPTRAGGRDPFADTALISYLKWKL